MVPRALLKLDESEHGPDSMTVGAKDEKLRSPGKSTGQEQT